MHPLHIIIAKIILGTKMAGCQVILGKDCGGDQNIQLFCKCEAEMATRFCSVDAIVLKNGQVKVIVEIEESDIRPVALSGKAFVSSHASYFIHRNQSFPIAFGASFVQVIDTRKLSKRSSKLTQCQYLRDAIRSTLSKNGNIRHYEVFHGDIAEFERPGPQQELRDHIRTACFQ